jgi:hypothetical protein
MSNDHSSLASYLFDRIVQHQNDQANTKIRPRLYPSGFVFDERDIEKWIQDHKDHENNTQSQ